MSSGLTSWWGHSSNTAHFLLFSGLHLHSQGFAVTATSPSSKSHSFWESPSAMLRNKCCSHPSAPNVHCQRATAERCPVPTTAAEPTVRTLHSRGHTLTWPSGAILHLRWPGCTLGKWLPRQLIPRHPGLQHPSSKWLLLSAVSLHCCPNNQNQPNRNRWECQCLYQSQA